MCCCAAPLSGDPAEGRPADDVRVSVLPSRGGDPVVAGADLAATAGADTLAVEEHHLTVTRHRALSQVAPRLRLTDLACAVEAAAAGEGRRGDRLPADRRRDRRPGPGGAPRVDPGRPHRAASRAGTGAPPGRPRRGRPGLPHLRRRPARTPAAPDICPPTGGSRRATSSVSGWAPTTAATAARSAGPSSSAPRPRTGRSSCTTSFSQPSGPVARRSRRVWSAATWTGWPAMCWTPAGYGERLGRVDRARCGTRNRRGPSVVPCGHG